MYPMQPPKRKNTPPERSDNTGTQGDKGDKRPKSGDLGSGDQPPHRIPDIMQAAFTHPAAPSGSRFHSPFRTDIGSSSTGQRAGFVQSDVFARRMLGSAEVHLSRRIQQQQISGTVRPRYPMMPGDLNHKDIRLREDDPTATKDTIRRKFKDEHILPRRGQESDSENFPVSDYISSLGYFADLKFEDDNNIDITRLPKNDVVWQLVRKTERKNPTHSTLGKRLADTSDRYGSIMDQQGEYAKSYENYIYEEMDQNLLEKIKITKEKKSTGGNAITHTDVQQARLEKLEDMRKMNQWIHQEIVNRSRIIENTAAECRDILHEYNLYLLPGVAQKNAMEETLLHIDHIPPYTDHLPLASAKDLHRLLVPLASVLHLPPAENMQIATRHIERYFSSVASPQDAESRARAIQKAQADLARLKQKLQGCHQIYLQIKRLNTERYESLAAKCDEYNAEREREQLRDARRVPGPTKDLPKTAVEQLTRTYIRRIKTLDLENYKVYLNHHIDKKILGQRLDGFPDIDTLQRLEGPNRDQIIAGFRALRSIRSNEFKREPDALLRSSITSVQQELVMALSPINFRQLDYLINALEANEDLFPVREPRSVMSQSSQYDVQSPATGPTVLDSIRYPVPPLRPLHRTSTYNSKSNREWEFAPLSRKNSLFDMASDMVSTVASLNEFQSEALDTLKEESDGEESDEEESNAANIGVAWKGWKDRFRTDTLKDLDEFHQEVHDTYGLGKQKPVQAGDFNPAAFIAQITLHGHITYTDANGAEARFTKKDLISAMDPDNGVGQDFLQTSWRVINGSSWAGAGKYKLALGDKEITGQHEWIPTATVGEVLHQVLTRCTDVDKQLAWISTLEMLRTPTSEVAIKFTPNMRAIEAAKKNPQQAQLSKLGVWEHHSGGLYDARGKQINKGNNTFHKKLSSIIAKRVEELKPDHDSLPDLLEDLKTFVDDNLLGGEGIKVLRDKLPPHILQQIPNTFSKNKAGDTYGELDFDSVMETVPDLDGTITKVGRIETRKADDLEDLLNSFEETKQRAKDMLDRRIRAIHYQSRYRMQNHIAFMEADTDGLMTMAMMAHLSGEYVEAEDRWRQIHDHMINRWGEGDLMTATSAFTLGLLCQQNGHYDEAKELLVSNHQALDAIYTRVGPTKELGDSYAQLAKFHAEFNQPDNAEEMIRKSIEIYTKKAERPSGETDLEMKQEMDLSLSEARYFLASLLIEKHTTLKKEEKVDSEEEKRRKQEEQKEASRALDEIHKSLLQYFKNDNQENSNLRLRAIHLWLANQALYNTWQEGLNKYDPRVVQRIERLQEQVPQLHSPVMEAKFKGIFASQLGGYHLQRGKDHKNEGQLEIAQRQLEEAQVQMREALSAFQAFPLLLWREEAETLKKLGDLHELAAEYYSQKGNKKITESEAQERVTDHKQKMEECYLQALATYKNERGDTAKDSTPSKIVHPFQLEVINKLLSLYNSPEDEPKRKKFLDTQVVSIDPSRHVISPEIANLCRQAAVDYQTWGDYKQAETLLSDAYEISRKRRGRSHPETITLCQELVTFYIYQDKYPEAQSWVDRLYRHEPIGRLEGDPYTLRTIDLAGLVYEQLGMHEQAKEFYERALTKPMQYSKPEIEEIQIITLGQTKSSKKKFYEEKIQFLTQKVQEAETEETIDSSIR